MKVTNEGLPIPLLSARLGQENPDPFEDVPDPPDEVTERLVHVPYAYGGTTPALVQSAIVETDGGNSLDWPATPTAGNLLTVWATRRDNPGVAWAVGSEMNSYTALSPVTADTGRHGRMFYKIAEGDEVTCDFDGAIGNYFITIAEWSGATYSGIVASQSEVASTTDLDCGGSITPDAGVPCFLFGGSVIAGGDGEYPGRTTTPDASVVELLDSGAFATGAPGHWSGYLEIASPSGSYTVGGTLNAAEIYGGTTIVIVGVAAGIGWRPSGLITDVEDYTETCERVETDDGGVILRLDLDAPRRIGHIILTVGTQGAGSRTYTWQAAELADFSDAVTAAQETFTATGSFVSQDVDFAWTPTASYRYWQLISGTSEDVDLCNLEMYEALPFASGGVSDHPSLTGRDTAAQHPADSVTYDNTASGLTATDVQAAIDELEAFDLGWYNVEDYGAVHDAASISDADITAATDDTASIQAAIDACATAGGGTVWFPAGIYAIKGALQDTGTYNSQLEIPDNAGPGWMSIRFLGAGAPAANPAAQSSILRSDWNGVISGAPAIIAAGTHDSTSYNFVVVSFENIAVVAHEDPKLTAIDMTNALGVRWDNLVVNVNRADAFTFPVPWDVPTNANAVGVDMPYGLNSQPFDGGAALFVEGYYIGLRPSEQCAAHLVKVAFCAQGIVFRGQQGTPAFWRHLCHIDHVASFWNPRSLVFSGDLRWVIIDALDVEHDDTPFEAVYDIDDASNYGRGFISWHTTDFSTGPEDNLLVNGATGLSLFGPHAKRWKLNSVVHVPTGTDPATNPATGRYVYTASATGNLTVRKPDGSLVDLESTAPGGAAGGDLSGTYPNPSVVDDSHSHTSATAPSGIGEILISDTPSTPLVFADLIQNEAQDDLVYADP